MSLCILYRSFFSLFVWQCSIVFGLIKENRRNSAQIDEEDILNEYVVCYIKNYLEKGVDMTWKFPGDTKSFRIVITLIIVEICEISAIIPDAGQ